VPARVHMPVNAFPGHPGRRHGLYKPVYPGTTDRRQSPLSRATWATARQAGLRHPGTDGSQPPVPQPLPRSVSDTDGPAAADIARNADYLRDVC